MTGIQLADTFRQHADTDAGRVLRVIEGMHPLREAPREGAKGQISPARFRSAISDGVTIVVAYSRNHLQQPFIFNISVEVDQKLSVLHAKVPAIHESLPNFMRFGWDGTFQFTIVHGHQTAGPNVERMRETIRNLPVPAVAP